jgi:hypothetical protein
MFLEGGSEKVNDPFSFLDTDDRNIAMAVMFFGESSKKVSLPT